MLDLLDKAMFDPHLNQSFELTLAAGERLSLELIQTRALGSETVPHAKRKPFALVFRGPSSPALPQQIYPLENPAFARLEIFLVPVGKDGEGIHYEAVFT